MRVKQRLRAALKEKRSNRVKTREVYLTELGWQALKIPLVKRCYCPCHLFSDYAFCIFQKSQIMYCLWQNCYAGCHSWLRPWVFCTKRAFKKNALKISSAPLTLPSTKGENANKFYELYWFIDHNVIESADCKNTPEKNLKTAYSIGQTRESETKQMQLNGNTLTFRNFSASDNWQFATSPSYCGYPVTRIVLSLQRAV